LEDAGQPFSEHQDRTLMNVPCKRIQVDEGMGIQMLFFYFMHYNFVRIDQTLQGDGCSLDEKP
jgi:hypothetical protein